MADGPRRPGRPRDARVDGVVLEATLHELATEGYAGLSVDKVAARAGVSKATIYRRWASREEMILDAFRQACPPKREHPDTGSLRGDVEARVVDFHDGFDDAMTALLPQIVAAVHQSPKLKELFDGFLDEELRPLVDVFERAARRGELRAGVDPAQAAEALAGMLFSRLLLRGRLLTGDELRSVFGLLIDGVAARS